MTTMNEFIESIEAELSIADTIIADFAERLKEDASGTLFAADDMYKAAADHSVCLDVKLIFEGADQKALLPVYLRMLEDGHATRAERPPSSSSASQNLMDAHMRAATARLIAQMKRVQ
jgi:hypothetical protein